MWILIVDDSEDIRLLLGRYLEKAGYKHVLQAVSAQQAFRLLGMGEEAPSSAEGRLDIDLILLDIVMQGMDGVDACRRIRETEAHADTPIIMVSAISDVALLEEAFDAGATDYVEKPVNKIELLARMRSALRLKEEMDRRKQHEALLMNLTAQLKEANEALRALTISDGLTGVANRRRFDEYIQHEWNRAQRTGLPLSLLMIDIDDFKAYNDTYGHQAGDDCLKQVAEAINRALHRPADLVARYGGEEFAVVLPDTDEAGAVELANSLREVVAGLGVAHRASRAAEYVTISLGVASQVPSQGQCFPELINMADQALYQAKHQGRNRVVYLPFESCLKAKTKEIG
ncbi:diguanylate cyclase [Pseudomonadota bacterium]